MATFRKDPDALLDYKVDWGESWLPSSDAITLSTAFVDHPLSAATSAIKVALQAVSGGRAHVIWLSAGVSGVEYTITSRITTSDGRLNDQSFTVLIEQL